MISSVFSGDAPVNAFVRKPAQNVRFGYATYPDRDSAIFVSGSSKTVTDVPALSPYTQTLEKAMRYLTQGGTDTLYSVISGGYTGIGQAAHMGSPGQGFVVSVTGWDAPFPNQRVDGKWLYRQVSPEKSGLRRTDKLIQKTNYVVIAPGGIGTLEELSAILEAKYYYDPAHPVPVPDKVILLDGPVKDKKTGEALEGSFWQPLAHLFNNMSAIGVSNDKMKVSEKSPRTQGNDFVSIIRVNDSDAAAKDIVEIITGRCPEQISVMA